MKYWDVLAGVFGVRYARVTLPVPLLLSWCIAGMGLSNGAAAADGPSAAPAAFVRAAEPFAEPDVQEAAAPSPAQKREPRRMLLTDTPGHLLVTTPSRRVAPARRLLLTDAAERSAAPVADRGRPETAFNRLAPSPERLTLLPSPPRVAVEIGGPPAPQLIRQAQPVKMADPPAEPPLGGADRALSADQNLVGTKRPVTILASSPLCVASPRELGADAGTPPAPQLIRQAQPVKMADPPAKTPSGDADKTPSADQNPVGRKCPVRILASSPLPAASPGELGSEAGAPPAPQFIRLAQPVKMADPPAETPPGGADKALSADQDPEGKTESIAIDPGIRRVDQLTINIAPPEDKDVPPEAARMPENLAAAYFAKQTFVLPQPLDYSLWLDDVGYGPALNFPYRPLYFEEINLERYGHSWGPAQPFLSAANFVGSVIMLPYNWCEHPDGRRTYHDHHFRPGGRGPRELQVRKFNPLGTAAESAAMVGFVLLIP